MAETPTGSWWQTLPGILAATATFLTAITGLVMALFQIGVFTKPGTKAETEPQPRAEMVRRQPEESPRAAAMNKPPFAANCGGNADTRILRPITLLYQAVNRKDYDLYSQQLAAGLTYHNNSSKITQNRDQKLQSKRKSFDKLDTLTLTMDKNPEIISKSANSAEVEVTYSMTYTISGQGSLTQNGILEKYTVICDPSGLWLINVNIDEISSSGPPHR